MAALEMPREMSLFTYSDRPLIKRIILLSLAFSIVPGLFGILFPSASFAAGAIDLMLLFAVLTALAVMFLLSSRKYEFYSESMVIHDGYLKTYRIPYSRIVHCRPVYPKNFLPSREEEVMNWSGQFSVMELKVLFKSGTFVIRENPHNPILRIDLYDFINQKIRQQFESKQLPRST